jgi:uncharacterized protein (DUF885 family)
MSRTTWSAMLWLLLLTGCGQDAGGPAATAVPADAAVRRGPVTEGERINAWFDEQFEAQVQMSPRWLARLARKERYDEYDDLSEAATRERLEWLAATVREMESSFSYASLDLEARTSWDLWKYSYEQAREAFDQRRQSYVFTQMMGPQSSLAQFMIRFHKVDTEADMVAYNKRLQGIGQAVSDLLDTAQTNAAAGARPPRFAYEGARHEATNLISGEPFQRGADSPLLKDAQTKIAELVIAGEISEARGAALQADTEAALVRHFLPAYERLIQWLDTDVDNVGVAATGVHDNPNGQDYYAHRLRISTTTDLSADEIHGIGLAEVERIRDEMEAIRVQIGFEGDLESLFRYLKEDDLFLYPNTDEGRQGYLRDSEEYLAVMNRKLPDYFGILPRADLVVRRVEAFREQDGAPQHYLMGAPDGSRPGVYYAHLSDMRSMPKHLMEAVAYHEGNPGHHMQISIAQESTLVPKFRTQNFYTAYTEGWGLYAERLAKEMGAYQDPYSDFGRLSTEMWRAIRLVVDTGIHAKGWTEAGAVAYFQANSAVADGAIRAEVRRYFAWPGQATAYKIGMLKLLELREYARAALGTSFDIRAFHDVVLGGGALPLHILERRVRNWVAQGGIIRNRPKPVVSS